MADDRWRDDERRRWDEERYRSEGQGSSQGMRGQGGHNQSYNRGYGPGGYPQGGGQGNEQGGRNFERGQGQGGWGGSSGGMGGQGYGQGMSGYPYGESGHAYAPGSQIWDQGRNFAQEQGYEEPPRRYEQSSGEGGYAPRRYGQRGYDSQTGYGQGAYGQFGSSGPYGEPYPGGGRQEYERNREYGYGGEMRRSGQQGRWNQPGWNEREYERGRGGQERSWWNRASDEVASWVGDEDAERRRRMDAMRGHAGRGPRGYTRSDERIREDVSDQLTDDSRVDASEIDVNVRDGEVTLSGTVRTRDERRRAEDVADNISGVKHVQNNIRIQHQGQYQSQHQGQYQGQHQGMSSSSSMGTSSGSTGSASGSTGTSGSTGGTSGSSGSTTANRTSTNTAS